jgi:predicted DNA-binding protein (UPF0251 family)
VNLFKPAGVPASTLETALLALDELEAMRLVDEEGLDQSGAAERMKVSRATVGRILERGRHKVTRALVHGQALAIADGNAPLRFHPPAMSGGRGYGRGRHRHGRSTR